MLEQSEVKKTGCGTLDSPQPSPGNVQTNSYSGCLEPEIAFYYKQNLTGNIGLKSTI